MFHYPPARVEVPFDYLLLTVSIQLPVYAIILLFIEPFVARIPSHILPFFAREVLLMRPGAVPRPWSSVGCPVGVDFAKDDGCIGAGA